MHYAAKDYSHLIGMEGFSENLLRNHFTLYQGYVNNTNRLMETLSKMLDEEKTGTPEYAEIKRRFGWEFDGMRLHEFYFENLGGRGGDVPSSIASRFSADFGSAERWLTDIKATAAMRGIGWAVLYYDPIGKHYHNSWINEHDVGHTPGCVPILVLDVFEHAYMLDYGLKRPDYVATLFKNVNWDLVGRRINMAEELAQQLERAA